MAARTVKSGTHIICHCRDCRAFQVALGQPDPGAETGISIFQIAPAGLALHGEMAALRLSPRGPFRFYAPCCGTPIATTLTRRTMPFAGMLSGMVVAPERLGPVRAHVHMTGLDGKVTHRHMGRMVRALFSNAGSTYLRGEARLTPFFDAATGRPVVEPVVIEKARKAEIYSAL